MKLSVRRLANRRVWPGWVSVLVPLVLVFSTTTCRAGPDAKPDEESAAERPIRPDEKTERVRFEEALTALQKGRYDEAKEAFRLLQAEEESKKVAELAELYVARAQLGDLQGLAGGEGSPSRGVERGRQMLASLSVSEKVDGRVRRAAAVYRALVDVKLGRGASSYKGFEEYPDEKLGSAVLEGDRLGAWGVLIEGLHRAERSRDAMLACAGLYREVSVDRGDEREEEKTGEKETELREFSRARGFAAAEALEVSTLEKHLDAESGFVRAVAGWSYLDRRLDTDRLEKDARQKIDERFTEVAADLNAIGAASRVGEISVKLATVGGGKRLVIGALIPMSKPNRGVGAQAMNGMLLGMQAFSHSGPPRVTLVFEDSNAKPTRAFRRLKRAGVAAVVGPLDQGRAAKFAPLAEKQGIPLLAMTARHPTAQGEKGEGKPVALRNFMDPITEARAAANLAFHEFGDRRASIAYPNIGYGKRLMQAFAEEFRDLGGRVVASVGYDREKSDFADIADRMAHSNPDAIFIPDSASKVAELTAFFANRDVWGMGPDASKKEDAERTFVHYLGTSLWYDSILVRQASNYVDGAVVPAWYASVFKDNATQQFGRRFEAVFGQEPENIAAFAFDNVQ